MDFVIFAAPNYTENAVRFLSAVADVPGTRFGLISQEPPEWLPGDVRRKVTAFARVSNIFDRQELTTAVETLARQYGRVHRLMATVEQLQEEVAVVRELLGIEGMPSKTIRNFRDKAQMKVLLRETGLPCAHHRLVENLQQAQQFVEAVGFPVVVKPPDGAASQSTYKVLTADELATVLGQMQPSAQHPVLLEEFITGTEHSFDTFSLDGKPIFHSLTHYYPTPLEVIRETWIQWQVLLPREVEDVAYDDIREAAFRTLDVLGMRTGMTHLEWFRRQDGSLAISEVAARPPGAQFTTLIGRANDFDAVAAWAELMVHGTFRVPERKYAAGAAYLRGTGQGRVVAVHGLDLVDREVGHLITDFKIPKPGQEKSLSYEGEGYIILRHADTEVVRRALLLVVSNVRVELG